MAPLPPQPAWKSRGTALPLSPGSGCCCGMAVTPYDIFKGANILMAHVCVAS
jgi:hypothetical protein